MDKELCESPARCWTCQEARFTQFLTHKFKLLSTYFRSHSLYIRRERPLNASKKRRSRSLQSPSPTYHPGIVPAKTEKLPRPVVDKYKRRRRSEDTFMSMVLKRFV